MVYNAKSLIETGESTMASGFVDKRAPLYTYCTMFFFYLFGISETTARLPAVVFGILSIVMVYVLSARIFNRKVALWAVFFMTFSQFIN